MTKLTDEQIQALLDKELTPQSDVLPVQDKEQVEKYQSLFQKLNTEPAQGLPFSFASRVTGQLKIKLKKRSDIRFNLLAVLGIVIGLFAAYGAIITVDVNAGNYFFMAVLKYKWLLIFGSLILLGTLMFDQRVVERTENGRL